MGLGGVAAIAVLSYMFSAGLFSAAASVFKSRRMWRKAAVRFAAKKGVLSQQARAARYRANRQAENDVVAGKLKADAAQLFAKAVVDDARAYVKSEDQHAVLDNEVLLIQRGAAAGTDAAERSGLTVTNVSASGTGDVLTPMEAGASVPLEA